MANINETFDAQKYDEFIKSTNYSGALNYLTDLYNNTDDFDERDALKPFMSNLRQKIHRDESMIRYATDTNQVNQYYFLDAIKNGTSIEQGKNSYYDRYTNVLAGLGNTYNKDGNVTGKANQLQFTFNSNKTFRAFLDNMGMNEEQIGQMNVLLGSDQGGRTLMINKSNPYYYNIINNIYKTQNQELANEPLAVTGGGEFFAMEQVNRRLQREGISYKAYDNRGRALSNNSTLYDGKFNRAMVEIESLMNEAESTYGRLEKLANQDLIVSSFRLPWKTAAHARAEELLNSTGDTEEYNRTIARLDDQLENALHGLVLSQQNVYSTRDSDDPNYHRLDLEEAHEYQQVLRDALREKRATIAMAMYGDKFGYQIDIDPKSDSKGGFFSEEDKSNIHRTMFIENPWPQEDMTRAFEQRTEFRAIKELILMDMYKYPYDFEDGSSVMMTNSFSGVYKHADGYEELIDKDKALSILNENFIKEDGIRTFAQKYKDSKNVPQFKLGEFKDGIDKNIWAFAMKAAEELVPDTSSNAYIEKAYDLYQSILTGIKYKEAPAVTKVQ